MSDFDSSSLSPGALAAEFALQRFAISSAPTIHDHQHRIDVINKITRALNDALQGQGFSQLSCLPFGSFVSGLYRATSDVDLCLTGYIARTAIKPRFHADMDLSTRGLQFIPLVSNL